MTTQAPSSPTGVAPAASVSPEPILKLAFGFMATKHLFAASELGIFEALADSPANVVKGPWIYWRASWLT